MHARVCVCTDMQKQERGEVANTEMIKLKRFPVEESVLHLLSSVCQTEVRLPAVNPEEIAEF